MTATATPTLTATCGCTFTGRMYTAAGCTVLDLDTCTGTERMRHAMKAERAMKRAAKKATTA